MIKKIIKDMKDKAELMWLTARGQAYAIKHGTSLVEGVVAVVVGIIMIAEVAIPTVNDSVANLTGTTRTILSKAPILLAVAGLLLVVALMGMRQN